MHSAPSSIQSKRDQRGLSIIELLIAMTIFVLASAGITFLVIDGMQATRRSSEQREAIYLTQQGYEAAVSIRNQGWHLLTSGSHGLTSVNGHWEFSSNYESLGKYTRTITVAQAMRNAQGDLVSTGGTLDQDTKWVNVETTWAFSPLRTGRVTMGTYLTNWQAERWVQSTQADFDAGTANSVITTNNDGGTFQLGSGSGGAWGNQSVLDATGSMGSMTTSQHISSVRFTAAQTKSVTHIRVYLQNENGVSPTYRFGLRADTAGTPAATWLGATEQGYGDAASTTTGWRTIALTEPVPITAGGVYHLVTVWQSGTVNGSRYIALRNSTPQNLLHAYDNLADPVSATLISTNNGGSWTVQAAQPLYLLGFSDATFTGWPWISKTDVRVSGNRRVGEQFTLTTDMTVTGATFSVRKSAAANPAADLVVSLGQVGGGVIATGTLVSRTAVTSSYADYTVNFTTPQFLQAGIAYRIFLSSQGANTPFYEVRQLNTTNSAEYISATFQADNAVYTLSTNSGTSWSQSSVSDIGGFSLITESGYATSGDLISSEFDTNSLSPTYQTLLWTADVPSGTVEFQIRTADSQAGLATALWVGPDGTDTSRYSTSGQQIVTAPGSTGTRWIQWRAFLTSNGVTTPTISDVTITYEP